MKDKMVTLATDHYTSAEVLKARLEDAGIDVYLKHVNLIQGAASEGVKIQIRTSDVEKALRLMSEWKRERDEKESKDLKSIRRILVPVDFSEFSIDSVITLGFFATSNIENRRNYEIRITFLFRYLKLWFFSPQDFFHTI